MEKRRYSYNSALCCILIVVIFFGTLAVLQYKFKFMGELPNPFESKSVQPSVPPMPEAKEVKSEPPFKSPVLDKAWKLRDEDELLQILIEAYYKEGFKISVFTDNAVATVFLKELFEDKDSLRIFHYFSVAGIRIHLSDKYIIGSGYVHINARDGVKKTAKWLAEGKI